MTLPRLPIDRRRFLILAVALALPAAAAAQTAVDDFMIAVANDRVDTVRAMLAKGVDPNVVGKDGHPALVTAAREGSANALDALLAAGAKGDARSSYGDTALMLASLNGRLEIAKKLRAKGAALDYPGWTPLIYAATGGHDEVVKYLLGEGAKINATSPNGTSALMMATREGKFATAELLIARGADVNHRNGDGASALTWAERNDDKILIERLKRAGAK